MGQDDSSNIRSSSDVIRRINANGSRRDGSIAVSFLDAIQLLLEDETDLSSPCCVTVTSFLLDGLGRLQQSLFPDNATTLAQRHRRSLGEIGRPSSQPIVIVSGH
jgi:hypothetical protein